MATITLRSVKGSPLTNTEVDNNFSNMNTELGTKLNTSSYTAADVLSKLLTVDGASSGLDADTVDAYNASQANTVSTIVVRDSAAKINVSGVILAGSTSGTANLVAPAVAGATTITLPSASGTLISTGDTLIISNGMLAGSITDAKLSTISSSGKVSNSATTATNANTASAIVARDASGNFSAGTITANLTGNATTATSATSATSATTATTATTALACSGNAATATTATTATTANDLNTANNYQVNSLGVGTAGSATAGEIRATNNITAYFTSDRRFKENIQDVDNALEKVCAIGSKTYDWSDEYIISKGGEDGYFVTKSDFGVVAQDVKEVFPQAVRTREDGTLAVDYEKLSTLAFGAIKELVKRIEILENR